MAWKKEGDQGKKERSLQSTTQKLQDSQCDFTLAINFL